MKVELSGFIKMEGGVKLPNQFHVSRHIHNEEIYLVDGINQVHNTCFDVESVKSGVMSRFTWNNGYLVDFFISFLL